MAAMIGGARRWGRGRGRAENQRAEAQAAKDAAADAFYELDTAQRDLRISVEMVTTADDSPEARRAAAGFDELGRRIDRASHAYIAAVDAHDLDRDDLRVADAVRARHDLVRARENLEQVRAGLERFREELGPLLRRAETQLARLAPAVERARQGLRAAADALEAVRASGLRADDLAGRLAALSPEVAGLTEGASRHGVQGTVQRADRMLREAEAVRREAERLPERAVETDRRLRSLCTRAEALHTRADAAGPVLSELRRRFSLACWEDLQQAPEAAVHRVRQAEERLAEARRAREEQRWADATARLSTVRALLNDADEAVSAVGERLRRLDEVSSDHTAEVERTRFAIRDAQRLAMAGRSRPDSRHAGPLDDAVGRLERAVAGLSGPHPDWWGFVTELEAIRRTVAQVVQDIRSSRAVGG